MQRSVPLLAAAASAVLVTGALWWWSHAEPVERETLEERRGDGAAAAPLAGPVLVGRRADGAVATGQGGSVAVAQQAQVEGRVLTPEGSPIAGALVRTITARGDVDARLFHESGPRALTDDQGRFRLAVPVTTAEILATAAGYLASPEQPRPWGRDLEIRLRRAKGRVVGTVRDEQGRPVAGARVVTGYWWEFGCAGALTSQDGTYAVARSHDGVVDVRAWAPGYSAVEAEAPPAAAADASRLDLVLPPGVLVRGRVLAQDTGLGVAGAEVLHEEDHEELMDGTVCDAAGAFELVVGREASHVEARAEGFCPGTGELEKADDGATSVEIRLQRHVTFEGTVFDPGGRPLGGAEVLAHEGSTARSGPDGRFRVTGPRPRTGDDTRPTLIAARLGELTPGVALVHREQRTGIELRLAAPRPLVGRVVDGQGRPRGDVRVGASMIDWADGHHGRSPLLALASADAGEAYGSVDAEGRFRFAGLPAGGYEVWARPARAGGRAASVPARVDPGEPGPELTIVVEDGMALRGVVVDPQGDPIPDATVWIPLEDPDGAPEVMTDRAGRFEVLGIPLQPVELQVSAPGCASRDEPVDPREGEVRVVLERLPTWRLRLRLDGHVPPDGIQIELDLDANEGSCELTQSEETVQGGEATFEVRGRPGPYRLSVRSDECYGEPLEVEVPAGGGEVACRVVLQRSLAIAGVVRDGQGAPVADAQLWMWGVGRRHMSLTTDDQGTFHKEGLEPGEWNLNVRKRGFQTLTRKADSGDLHIELVLEPAVEVQGTVAAPALSRSRLQVAFAGASPDALQTAQVSADGTFQASLAPGDYAAYVTDRGSQGPRVPLRLEAGHPLSGLQLEAPPAGRVIRGRVFLPGGQPAGRVSVRAEPQAGDPDDDTVVETEADAAGRFELGGLIAPAYHVWARAVTAEGGLGPVRPDGPEVEIRLIPRGTVAGLARRPAGGPIERGEVTIVGGGWSDSAELTRGGRFLLQDVPPGTYRIEVHAGAEAGATSEPVQVQPGQTLRDVVVELLPAAAIEGVIEDEQGRPVPDGWATIERENGDNATYAEADAQGRFRIEGLLPGSWRVRANDAEGLAVGEVVTLTLQTGQTGTARLLLLSR